MQDAQHNSLEFHESPRVTPPPLVAQLANSATITPAPQLLSSLGRLVRGLSVLFWGLPIALVVCVQTAKGDWFRPLGVAPPLIATGLLFYSLSLLAHFQRQERVWTSAIERTRILGLVNVGLAPFLYWWSRVPASPLFNVMVEVSMLCGLAFLYLLNPLILRLAWMLPDETLRHETKLFTDLNRWSLLTIFALLAIYLGATHFDPALPDQAWQWLLTMLQLGRFGNGIAQIFNGLGLWLLLLLALLPLAMTMALIWKTKEVILASVFGSEH